MSDTSKGNVYNTVKGATDGIMARGQAAMDAAFPPEQRSEFLQKLQAFITKNPMLSAFLLANVTLTGLPLLLFIVFSITVFTFSLVAALVIAVVAALLFTVFCVIVALVIVLPTVFITTMGATFLFLWGLGGYYILRWFNSISPAQAGEALGDKLNALTGGRLDFIMGPIRDQTAAVGVPLGSSANEKASSSDEKEPLLNGHNHSGPPKLETRNPDAAKAASDVKSKAGGATTAAGGPAVVTKGAVDGLAT